MEQVTVWHKVKKMHWVTNKHGKVVPYLQFTKGYEIEGQEYDGVSLYPHTIAEKKIGKGSQVKVQHKEGFMLEVVDVRFPKDQPEYLWCDACKTEIEEFTCPNPTCSAKGHTPIVKLMKWAFPMDSETAEKILKPYLQTFPVSPIEKAEIHDLVDYLQFVNPKMNPRTPLRKGILMNYESGNILHDFECQLFDWFIIKDGQLQMPLNAFWEAMSLRGLSARDYAVLQHVQPTIFLGKKSGVAPYLLKCGLSKKAVNTIISAADAIAQVVGYARLK